uniref:Uncharacterized protein n=1 Tax=Anguilla anguilla TaxID=7936 RepID=A0A0E9SLB3_ANGAN
MLTGNLNAKDVPKEYISLLYGYG